MFNSEHLYNLFKPKQNPDLITKYNVIIGGGGIAADFNQGVIVLNLLNSFAVSSNIRRYESLSENVFMQDKEHYSKINEFSYIQNDYQCDIYKKNARNISYIECEKEALKIRQWLNSFETYEYLAALDSEILPCYSNVGYSNEMVENKLAQRATFDFSIITKVVISENVGVVDKATIGNFKIAKE